MFGDVRLMFARRSGVGACAELLPPTPVPLDTLQSGVGSGGNEVQPVGRAGDAGEASSKSSIVVTAASTASGTTSAMTTATTAQTSLDRDTEREPFTHLPLKRRPHRRSPGSLVGARMMTESIR